jgi:hypothetical protein
MFRRGGCSLLRNVGFFCSLDVLHAVLRDDYDAILDEQIRIFFKCKTQRIF